MSQSFFLSYSPLSECRQYSVPFTSIQRCHAPVAHSVRFDSKLCFFIGLALLSEALRCRRGSCVAIGLKSLLAASGSRRGSEVIGGGLRPLSSVKGLHRQLEALVAGIALLLEALRR